MSIETGSLRGPLTDVFGQESKHLTFAHIMPLRGDGQNKFQRSQLEPNDGGFLDLNDRSLYLCLQDKGKKPESESDKRWKAGRDALYDKDYKEAEKQFKALLDLNKKEFGADSKEVASTYSLLGEVCEKAERYGDAKAYYKQAAETNAKSRGGDPYHTGVDLHNAAKMDVKQEKWKDAAAGYESAIKVLDSKDVQPASDNARMTETRGALKGYAEVLRKLGEKDKAKKAEERADQIYKDYLKGPEGPIGG